MRFAYWTPWDWKRARRTTMRNALGQITTMTIPGNYFFWLTRGRMRVLGLEVFF
jgi:hypothetical protein